MRRILKVVDIRLICHGSKNDYGRHFDYRSQNVYSISLMMLNFASRVVDNFKNLVHSG